MKAHIAMRTRRAGTLEAYRIFHGEIDGAPPHWGVDRFGPCLVVRAPDEASVTAHVDFLDAVVGATACEGAVLKLRESHQSRVYAGSVPEELELLEGPARLLVRLDDGYQTGLFVEGRAVRDVVSRRVQGGEVLSLFSYTGSASVRAALKGGKVTSVDGSKRAHGWARHNFERSGLDPNAHRWFVDDALSVLSRSRDDAWDAIILDPPAFGRAGRKTFKLERDLPKLAHHALRASREIVYSTHDPAVSDGELARLWKDAGRKMGLDVELERVPNGFDVPEGGRDWGRYHRGLVVRR